MEAAEAMVFVPNSSTDRASIAPPAWVHDASCLGVGISMTTTQWVQRHIANNVDAGGTNLDEWQEGVAGMHEVYPGQRPEPCVCTSKMLL